MLSFEQAISDAGLGGHGITLCRSEGLGQEPQLPVQKCGQILPGCLINPDLADRHIFLFVPLVTS